jgi:Zn-finger nucleic acid-binding protein
MNCPSCNARLEECECGAVMVDICSRCHGVWFDPDELGPFVEFLLKEEPSIPNAKIELWKKAKRPETSAKPARSCPVCGVPMKKFNYACDSNIILDKCPECGGIWTDADDLHAVAVYNKGNPKLDAFGRSLVKDKRRQTLMAIHDLARLFPLSLGRLIYPPKR